MNRRRLSREANSWIKLCSLDGLTGGCREPGRAADRIGTDKSFRLYRECAGGAVVRERDRVDRRRIPDTTT